MTQFDQHSTQYFQQAYTFYRSNNAWDISVMFSVFFAFFSISQYFSLSSGTNQYCERVSPPPLGAAGHQPELGFLPGGWHKNPVGRILIPVLTTQNLASNSAPLSKLQWWGMLSLWTAVALPFSRLKVLKQFTKLKIWSKQETIWHRLRIFDTKNILSAGHYQNWDSWIINWTLRIKIP